MNRSTTSQRIWNRGDAGFDQAVLGTSFNATDPQRRPQLLVQAKDVLDVVNAVREASRKNWKIGICSGGHSWAQNHIRDGGLLLDLSKLNHIDIDSNKNVVRIGPGVVAGELEDALKSHKLFFPVAHAYTVGLGGFLLQGGFGWNSRKLGLACESVIGIDVVLADGQLVHASETENSDLLWAARGAGPGFFGVVVQYHLRLHERPRYVGMKLQVFRMKHLEEVFTWADRVGPEVSDQVEFQMVMNQRAFGIFSPGIEVIAPVMADSAKQAREVVSFIDKSAIRSKASLTLPLLPLSLSFMMKAGEKTLFLPNTHWSADNMWIKDRIDPVLPQLRQIAKTQPPAPSHVLWLNWNPPARQTPMAFSVEARTYLALYGGVRHPELAKKHQSWATEHMKALAPYSAGIQLADENTRRRPAQFLSEENMTRLEAIRTRYDPNHRFHKWMGAINAMAGSVPR